MLTIEELEELELENKNTLIKDIPLLDELYVFISNEVHDSGFLMYKIYGVVYGKDKEIIYTKRLTQSSDVIHITPTFLRCDSEYRLPEISIDSAESNSFRIFTRCGVKIKINRTFPDFEFDIIDEVEE